MKHPWSIRWVGAAGLFLLFFCQCAAKPIHANQIVPVSQTLCQEMATHHVMNADAPVKCERLRLVKFSYVGFDRQLHNDGQIVVMDAVAEYVLKALTKLRDKRFPIAKARLLNAYDGDDDASMADNNTSAFNDRRITGGSAISLHAYGLAIDLNPIQNPYVKRIGQKSTISPGAGANYLNRRAVRRKGALSAGMAETVVDIFANNGFLIWGGRWRNPIDYQHFEVGRGLAEKLVRLPPDLARNLFALHVENYLKCRRARPREISNVACVAAQNAVQRSSTD